MNGRQSTSQLFVLIAQADTAQSGKTHARSPEKKRKPPGNPPETRTRTLPRERRKNMGETHPEKKERKTFREKEEENKKKKKTTVHQPGGEKKKQAARKNIGKPV